MEDVKITIDLDGNQAEKGLQRLQASSEQAEKSFKQARKGVLSLDDALAEETRRLEQEKASLDGSSASMRKKETATRDSESATKKHTEALKQHTDAVKENETAALVCLNNIADKVMNYSSTHVFDYYTLNADRIDFVIATTTAEGVTSYQTLSNTDLTDGVLNTLSVSVEAPTELDGGSVEIDAIPYAEDVQGIAVNDITFTLDNSLAFIATSGAAFYMNAGVRSNGDFNRESIVDSVTGDTFAGTWTDMTWSSDGWVRDTDGHPSLAIPAGCSVQFPTLIPTSFMHGDSQGGSRTGLTIEMMLRSSVVANLDEPVLEFTQSISVPTTTIPSGTIDIGVIVYPTKILVRGTNEYSKDIVQEVGLCEDTITHLAITFSPNYTGATGKNLCAIYVNGISNVAFAYDTNSTFGNGALKIGQDSTDVYLYLLRIYGRSLAGSEIIQILKNAIFEGVEFSRQQLDADNAIYDNGIQYQLAKSKYNCFIIEPDDPTADIPNVNNDKKVQSTIYFEYAGHPEMDTKIAHVPIDGQGTTSMRYFRWNLRGKFTDYKEEGGKITPACEWFYKDSNGQYKETPDFTGKEGFIDGYSDATTNAAGHTKTQRVTMKKNVASSPQGHKMGATALYDDLFTALGLKSELPDPNFRVAVWQYPFLGFRKSGNDYQFIGLYTGGPDKGCKTTFGYNKKGDYAKCMCIEGPNHNPRGTRFLHPWVNVWYDATAKEETLKFGLAPNAEEAWDDDFSAGYDSDDTNAASNILAMYVSEWKPAYDLVFHCSPYIASLQEAAITLNGVTSLIKDVINSSAEVDIVAYINSDIETFQGAGQRSNGEKNELMSFYDSNYDIWYYDNTAKEYIKLVRQDGDAQDGLWNIKTYLGLTGSPTTAEIVAARAAKFKAEMGNYFSVNQTLYHKCFCMLIGAKDNDAKNSYPFKHYTFANGGRWGWKQDDLDSIFDTDNNGMATVKYSVEHGDMNGAVEIFQGSDSAFWTLIWRNYQTGETSLQTMTANIMSRLGSMATSLGIAGSFLHESVINVLYHYFFGNSAKYFPVIAYQEDRDFTYITPWLLAGTTKPNGETYPVAYNQVEPLTQALGDRYQDERLWIERRVAYLFSKYSIGAFGDNTAGWGVFEFGLKTQFVFKLTPAIDLYPTGNVGGSSAGRRGARTAAGSEASVSMPSSGSGTSLYIKCTDWLASLGDLCETEFVNRNTGDEDAVLNISGKRLEEVKVGDVLASKVKFNAVGLAVSGAAIKVVNGLNTTTLVNPVNLANCPRLRKALFGGSTASGLLLPSGSRVEEVSFPEMTKDIFLDSQNKLTAAKLTLPQTSVVEGYYFYQCANLNPIAILEAINNSRLGYVTMIWNNVVEATSAQVSALKDLADRQCGNVSYEDNVITHNEGSPIVSGAVHVDVIDKEMYDAITDAFTNLTITYETMVDYIKFEDPYVAEICAYNWGDTALMPNGATLYTGEIDCEADTEASSDYLFACVTAYAAHKSSGVAGVEGSSNDISAVAAHTEQFTIEVEGEHITGIKVIQAASNTSTLVTLADSAAETNPFSQSGNKYTALVTTTNACQYLLVKVTTDADEVVSYNILTASAVHRHPAGMTKAQAALVTSLSNKFRYNELITRFTEMRHFTSVTILNDGNSNTNINGFVFDSCTHLEAVSPTNVTKLASGNAGGGYSNFSRTALTRIELPNIRELSNYIGVGVNADFIFGASLSSVAQYTFRNISNANRYANYIILATTPPTLASGTLYTNNMGGYIYVPDEVYDEYTINNATWSAIKSKIKKLSEWSGSL